MLTHSDSTTAISPLNHCAASPIVSVIVPTYCEAENLRELLTRVNATLAPRHCYELVVVDDDSPDETGRICQSLCAMLPVRLEVRKNSRGLSSAVIHGVNCTSGEILVVMDADLSHQPEAIPRLIEPLLLNEADFVIGSRYIDGGALEQEWGFGRRTISRMATLLARPLTSVSDPMSGFFAIFRDTFESVAKRLNPIGYKIGLELIVKLGYPKIVEVPILFNQRKCGHSKLGFREQMHYLRHLSRLYIHKLQG